MKKRKGKKEERKQDGSCALWGLREDLKERRGSCTQGTPIASGEISWDRRGVSGAWRRAQQPVCGRQDRVRPTLVVHDTTLHAPAWVVCLLVWTGAGCWNVGFGEQTWGEDCCGLCGDSLRGWEWGTPHLGMLLEEAQTTMEVKCHCWVTCEGQGHHDSLSPPTLAPAPRGTRRGSCWSGFAHPRQSPPLPPPTKACQCTPSHRLHPLLTGQGADAYGWPTCRGGAETKAEPQGLCD